MKRRTFLVGAGAAAVVAAVELATPHIISAQPRQPRPYELNNSSIDPQMQGLVQVFDSVYIFSSKLEKILSNGQIVETTIDPVGTVIKGKDDKGKDALLLLTADHTVSNYDRYSLTPDNQRNLEVKDVRGTYELKTDDDKTVRMVKLASDPEYDVALLRIPDDAKVKVFPYKFGDSNDLTIGSFIYLIGNPENLGKNTLEGMVSSKVNPWDIRFKFNTTTPLGTSGGPILAIRKGQDGKGQFELVGTVVGSYGNIPFGDGLSMSRIKEKFRKYLT